MLALIRENGLPFYQKQAGSKILYAHHIYHINPHDVEIRVTFHVDSKTFRYQLQCYYEGQPFSLSELKPVVVLTSLAGHSIIGNGVIFLSAH